MAIALSCASNSWGQWGNLKGKFVYEGMMPAPRPILAAAAPPGLVDESLVVNPLGGVANILVYCRTKGIAVNPVLQQAQAPSINLDIKNSRFEPRILPLVVTQSLVIQNGDLVNYGPNCSPIGDSAFNSLVAPGKRFTVQLHKSQAIPQPVACNAHPWMKAYILPRDNPHFAVSKPDGSFELKDLPVGVLEFQAWQEKAGYLEAPGWAKGRFQLTIKPGDNDLGTIKLSPKVFNR